MNNKEECLFCKSNNLNKKKAQFVPFIAERMFQSKPKETYFIHCNSCKINYSSYRPNDEEMSKLYTNYRDDFYQKQRQKYEPYYTVEFNNNLGHNPKEIFKRKNRTDILFKKHLNTDKITKVLDFGGDNGQFIPDCFINAEKYVYEISNVPTIEGVRNISEEELNCNSNFDFIMCCHVLEHVAYPVEIIEKLISYCKKDGYIYLEVPFEQIPFVNNYIHEHITVYSDSTFLKLPDIFKNIDIIDLNTDSEIIYILLQKKKISFVKKIIKQLTIKLKLWLSKKTNKLHKYKIIYLILKEQQY